MSSSRSIQVHILIISFLMIFTTLSNGQQLVLDGPSLGARRYYCIDEELVFTCTAPGGSIQWNVPSVINGEGFVDSQLPPLTMPIGGVNATIVLQEAMPLFITTLRIRNVPDITVQCLTDVPDSRSLSLTTSTTPSQVENVTLQILNDTRRSVIISWAPVNGTFDIQHYHVQLCIINRACTDIMNIANSSLKLEGVISDDDTAYALISAVSQCGDVGSPGRSNDASLQIIMVGSTSQNLDVVIGLGVVLALAVLVIFVLLTLLICTKFFASRDVKNRSAPINKIL